MGAKLHFSESHWPNRPLGRFLRGRSIIWAVAKPSILPTTARKRGNPNWGKLMEPAPDLPTAFEEQVKKLGLSEQNCATSEKLREFLSRMPKYCENWRRQYSECRRLLPGKRPNSQPWAGELGSNDYLKKEHCLPGASGVQLRPNEPSHIAQLTAKLAQPGGVGHRPK
jgi:hypothetical protein